MQAGTTEDPDLTLEGIAAGSQVELAISAVNSGGESERTVVQTATVPQLKFK